MLNRSESALAAGSRSLMDSTGCSSNTDASGMLGVMSVARGSSLSW